MTRALVTLIAVAFHSAWSIGVVLAEPALSENVEFVATRGAFSKYRLKSNGMPIYLSQNDAAPVVTFMVVYHVGSRNEAPGFTGSVHLLEHMLSNRSTENFNKAKGHKTIREALYEAGVSNFSSTNMTTAEDRMNSYFTLPSGYLELAMKIEADRLGRALVLDEERRFEMTVVRNEYEFGEEEPSRVLRNAVDAAAIVAHPYHWPVIGYRSDIEGVSTDKLRELYKTFFSPNNAEAILVGDFDMAKALAMFDREFGSFAASANPIPSVITVEPPQEGERRVVVKRPGQTEIVQVAFIRPGVLDPDFIPLFVLAILLTDNPRLPRALVETHIASSVSAGNKALRDPYLTVFEAVVARGSTHEKTENALKAALYDVAKSGVTDEEVRRAQKLVEVMVIQNRDGTLSLASSFGEAIASANWEWWDSLLDATNRVTAADITRVAAKYLVPDHATIGWLVSAEAAQPEAADDEPVTAPAIAAAPSGADGNASATTPAASTSFLPAAAVSNAQPFAKRTLRRVFKNGLTLDIVENHAVPTVALEARIFTGLEWKPGLAQLTANMLDRGTKTRDKDKIADVRGDAGAKLRYDAGIHHTTASGTGLSQDAKLLLETLADELQSPSFAPKAIENAKADLETAQRGNSQYTSWRASNRFRNIIYPVGHPYRSQTLDEFLASLASISRKEIVQFHRERYNASSLVLAISGDVDSATIASLVEKLFGNMPAGTRPVVKAPRAVPGDPVREAVTQRGKGNATLIYGAASGLTRNDPDYEAALIANAALGADSMASRIGKRVRESEGLSYSVKSQFYMSDILDGFWAVMASVAPANIKQTLASTKDEIDRYCREGISDEEVEIQKRHFAGSYQIQLATNAGIAAALADAEVFGNGPAYLDEFPERVRRVTRDQVNAAIKARLHPDKLNVIVAGDLDQVPE